MLEAFDEMDVFMVNENELGAAVIDYKFNFMFRKTNVNWCDDRPCCENAVVCVCLRVNKRSCRAELPGLPAIKGLEQIAIQQTTPW